MTISPRTRNLIEEAIASSDRTVKSLHLMEKDLKQGLKDLDHLAESTAGATCGLLAITALGKIALLVAASAASQEESKGSYSNQDIPKPTNAPQRTAEDTPDSKPREVPVGNPRDQGIPKPSDTAPRTADEASLSTDPQISKSNREDSLPKPDWECIKVLKGERPVSVSHPEPVSTLTSRAVGNLALIGLNTAIPEMSVPVSIIASLVEGEMLHQVGGNPVAKFLDDVDSRCISIYSDGSKMKISSEGGMHSVEKYFDPQDNLLCKKVIPVHDASPPGMDPFVMNPNMRHPDPNILVTYYNEEGEVLRTEVRGPTSTTTHTYDPSYEGNGRTIVKTSTVANSVDRKTSEARKEEKQPERKQDCEKQDD